MFRRLTTTFPRELCLMQTMVPTRTWALLLPNCLISILIVQGTLPLQQRRTPLWTTLDMKKWVGPLANRLPLKNVGDLGSSLPTCPRSTLMLNPPPVETGRTLVPGNRERYPLMTLFNPPGLSRLTPPTSRSIGTPTPPIPLRNLTPPLGPLTILAIQSSILVLVNVSLEKVSTTLRTPQPGPKMLGALENMTRTLLAPMTFTT